MARKKCGGTPLKVFSGKEATLNRAILRLYHSSKTPLTKYDAYKQIHNMKGYKHFASGTIYRRINALINESWLAEVGVRPGKVEGESVLYKLALRGEAALSLDKQNIDDFIIKANDQQLATFIHLLLEFGIKK